MPEEAGDTGAEGTARGGLPGLLEHIRDHKLLWISAVAGVVGLFVLWRLNQSKTAASSPTLSAPMTPGGVAGGGGVPGGATLPGSPAPTDPGTTPPPGGGGGVPASLGPAGGFSDIRSMLLSGGAQQAALQSRIASGEVSVYGGVPVRTGALSDPAYAARFAADNAGAPNWTPDQAKAMEGTSPNTPGFLPPGWLIVDGVVTYVGGGSTTGGHSPNSYNLNTGVLSRAPASYSSGGFAPLSSPHSSIADRLVMHRTASYPNSPFHAVK